jgi:eukaryotic translation initiation factor 2-alpha kinase 4
MEINRLRQPAFVRQTSHQDSDHKVHVLMAQYRSKKSNKFQIVAEAQQRWSEKLEDLKTAPILAVEIRDDDVLEAIEHTKLSDAEGWRKVVQGAQLNERQVSLPIHLFLTH